MKFLSETLDGNLVVCDDGFVIEHWTSIKRQSKNLRVDMVFDEDGVFEYSEIKQA